MEEKSSVECQCQPISVCVFMGIQISVGVHYGWSAWPRVCVESGDGGGVGWWLLRVLILIA